MYRRDAPTPEVRGPWSRRVKLDSMLVSVVVDQFAGDAESRRDRRQVMRGEEFGVGDFVRFDADLARFVLCGVSDHKRVREGPGLAAEVLDAVHFDADLFLDLPVHGLFQRLAGLDKAGDEGVHAGALANASGQENIVAALDKDDDHRGYTRIGDQSTVRAALGPLCFEVMALVSALTADLVAPVPVDDHGRATCYQPRALIERAERSPQLLEGERQRVRRRFVDFNRKGRPAVKLAHVVRSQDQVTDLTSSSKIGR